MIEPTVEEALHEYFLTTQSIFYLVFITCAGFVLHVACEKYGERYVILYTSLCSLIAAWTVLGSKAFMAFFRLTVEKGQNQLTRFPASFFAWAMLVVIIVAAVGSLHFLQCAMIYHQNNIVIPTYYATFTLSCIIGAAVVYREFEGLPFGSILLFFVGVSLAGVGVYIVSHKEKELPEDSDGDDDDDDDEEAASDNGRMKSRRDNTKRQRRGESMRLVEMDHLALTTTRSENSLSEIQCLTKGEEAAVASTPGTNPGTPVYLKTGDDDAGEEVALGSANGSASMNGSADINGGTHHSSDKSGINGVANGLHREDNSD